MRTQILCSIPAWLCLAVSALAAGTSVTFDGLILDSCTLALTTNGTLALSADGTTMGSEVGGGTPATVTIVSTGSHSITVGAPTLATAPAGYDDAGGQVEVAYSGQTLLSGVTQPYTSTATSFSVGTIALSTLQLNNRIVNAGGFASGSYQTQTVLTCS